MITYEPFWQTLEKSGENWYTLTHTHNINPATLHRIKHNLPLSTVTIDMFCQILKCDVSDIMKYEAIDDN